MEQKISGLKSAQVLSLHHQYGYNEIPEHKQSKILLWLKQFWGPLPWLLELVAILSFWSGNRIEGIIIILLLVMNSFISLFQRAKTDKSLSQLRQKLQINNRVLRDDEWKMTPTRDLVPGDIVRLRIGDMISADMELLEGSVSVDQSSITGESLPKELDGHGELYSGSVLLRGEATAKVVAIGLETKYGVTAQLLETSHPPTHMEKIIFTLIKYQFLFNVALIIFMSLYILFINGKISDILPLIIVLLITSVPVAFPTMFTVSQTFGASQLVRMHNNHGILVRRLAAVQDCASMNVLCTDKTGTLTKNSLTISRIVTYAGYGEDYVIEMAASCSNISDQDPIDKAVIEYAKEKNYKFAKPKKFIPFDPSTKQTQAVIDINSQEVTIYKGLPEIIFSQSHLTNNSYRQDLEKLSSQGYRIIAVSMVKNNAKPEILGLIAFEDPIREDSKPLISELIAHGIEIKMITGDNLETAKSIASQLGFEVRAVSTKDLVKNPDLVLSHNVFADAFPKDKLLIISRLQKAGYTVGMTGDGVNDSPALHQAEVGIAVANATDIAKNSASYILTNPGLEDIVTAVKVSREVFQRLRTWALNKVIKSFEIAMLSVLAYLITKNIILSPLLAVLFLFANDFVTISIATDHSRAEANPANWNLFRLIFSAVSLSVVLLAFLAISLVFADKIMKLDFKELASLTFVLLVFQGQASLYALRSWPHFWSISPSKTLYLTSAAVWIILIIAAIYGVVINKIPLFSLWFIFIVPIISLAITDILKNILPISSGDRNFDLST